MKSVFYIYIKENGRGTYSSVNNTPLFVFLFFFLFRFCPFYSQASKPSQSIFFAIICDIESLFICVTTFFLNIYY